MIRTASGTLISQCHERIVHGGRGDYVEILPEWINRDAIHVPEHAKWRMKMPYLVRVYYFEYRTNDQDFVKLYFQRKPVDYADYKVGYWYVSAKAVKIEAVYE